MLLKHFYTPNKTLTFSLINHNLYFWPMKIMNFKPVQAYLRYLIIQKLCDTYNIEMRK